MTQPPPVSQLVAFVKRVYKPETRELPLRDRVLDDLASGALDRVKNSTRVSDMLEEVFEKLPEGRRSPYRLELTGRGKQRTLSVERNDTPLDQFWTFGNDARTIIVWAEPLFFFKPAQERGKGRTAGQYIRFTDVNHQSLDRDAINKVLKSVDPKHPALSPDMVPAFHYQSSGDIAAVYLIEDTLRSLGIDRERKPAAEASPAEVQNSHVVIVGNKRMTPFIGDFQRGYEITVENTSVEISDAIEHRGEMSKYPDFKPSNDHIGVKDAFAVLTRRRNVHRDKVVTLIAGNHGRAIEEVAKYVTDEKSLRFLRDNRTLKGDWYEWPEHFQVLFKISVVKDGHAVKFQKAEPVAYREYSAEKVRIYPQHDSLPASTGRASRQRAAPTAGRARRA